ncbi:MAG: ferritin family protein [Deltaproteobacteria bacterium]|nr:ferritin family protein [Deltaproteobacteria bacterium]
MLFDHAEEKEAVKRAALIETNGHKFYGRLAEKTLDKKTKSVFKALANDEKKHLKIIEKTYFPEAGFTDTITDEEIMIEDYLKKSGAADLFTKRIDVDKLIKLVDEPRKALIVALDTERYSVEYFEGLAKSSISEDGKKICMELAEEERGHVKHIEGLLASLSMP